MNLYLQGIFAGLLLMIILFYILFGFRTKELSYFYYIIIIFCLMYCFVPLNKSTRELFLISDIGTASKTIYTALLIAWIFNGLFTQHYFSTKKYTTKSSTLLRYSTYSFTIPILLYLSGFWEIGWKIFLLLLLIVLGSCISVSIHRLKQGFIPAKHYIFSNGLLYIVGFLYTFHFLGYFPNTLFNLPLEYYLQGSLVIHVILFSFGIDYKVKLIQEKSKENELKAEELTLKKIKEESLRKEAEYKLQLMEANTENEKIKERIRIQEKISSDFHDELGHNLTKISLFSALLKKKKREEQSEIIEKIESVSQSLYENTRDLIWSLQPNKSEYSDLISYLTDFGNTLFDSTKIEFKTSSTSEAKRSSLSFSMDEKRALILICKELMHNSLKHSKATIVAIHFKYEKNKFEIEFSDNGIGFSTFEKHSGIGLSNIKKRATKAGLELQANHALFTIKKIA